MSKESILNSSRPFLYAIYRKWAKRACENLGVSPNEDGEGEEYELGDAKLSEEDYPTEFHRISDMDRLETMNALTNDAEFMKQFGKYLNQ